MKIILNPTAPAAREIDTRNVSVVPDLWHIAMYLKRQKTDDELVDPTAAGEAVLRGWHLAHDLLKFINALDAAGGIRLDVGSAPDLLAYQKALAHFPEA